MNPIVSAIPDNKKPGWYRPVITDDRGAVAISVSFATAGEAVEFGKEIVDFEAAERASSPLPLRENTPVSR